MSDTLLGALWTLDFMLLLARNGCAGVNIETGVNQLGFNSFYSPITDDGKGLTFAGVPYYGMLAFATAAKGNNQMIPINIDAPDESFTAYALGTNAKIRSFIAINRSRFQEAHLDTRGLGMKESSLLCLRAPSFDSKGAITLGDESVDAKGDWKPRSRDRVMQSTLSVPAMSAALLISE